MGMKKTGIARGLIYEICLLMFVAFIISIIAGYALTKPVAAITMNGLENIDVAFSAASIGLSAVLAFAISIISGLCAVFSVMRHEPMKILSERN